MWSPADLETAISMRKDGYSSALIAEKLGTTRNAVIGKLHRAGVPGGDVIHKSKNRRPSRVGPSTWSEKNLTETWAERKARLAVEKGRSL